MISTANAFPAYYIVSLRGPDDRTQMRSTVYIDALRIFKTEAADPNVTKVNMWHVAKKGAAPTIIDIFPLNIYR